jgi:cytochrome c peroxidase
VQRLPSGAVLHRQLDAQSPRRALLRREDDQRRAGVGRRPIKTFPLRGIKDSPPYLHDDRLLTLEDSVEFFNVVLGVKLTADEKKDLVAFLTDALTRRQAGRPRTRRPAVAGVMSLTRQSAMRPSVVRLQGVAL